MHALSPLLARVARLFFILHTNENAIMKQTVEHVKTGEAGWRVYENKSFSFLLYYIAPLKRKMKQSPQHVQWERDRLPPRRVVDSAAHRQH